MISPLLDSTHFKFLIKSLLMQMQREKKKGRGGKKEMKEKTKKIGLPFQR